MTNRNIEDLVTSAMGNSVTPARLQRSKSPGLVRRLLGNETVTGPFTDDLEHGEQPHYLFHTTNRVELPEETAEEESIFSLFGRSSFSPATLLVTDSRLVLIYNSGLDRITRTFDYRTIDEVQHQQIPRIERSLDITVDGEEFSFGMWDTEEYVDELSDAAAYISEKSGVDFTESAYDFEGDQFDDAADALHEQLYRVGNTAQEVDIRFVLKYAKDGASVGKTPRTAGIGFLLGAGYGIWADITREGPHEEPRFDPETIDAQTTAEEIVRWKNIGDRVGDSKGGMAGAAIGAAISIDQQVNNRKSTRILSELNLEPIGRQLEEGQLTGGSVEVATQALDSYSEGLGTLLADDFFERIW